MGQSTHVPLLAFICVTESRQSLTRLSSLIHFLPSRYRHCDNWQKRPQTAVTQFVPRSLAGVSRQVNAGPAAIRCTHSPTHLGRHGVALLRTTRSGTQYEYSSTSYRWVSCSRSLVERPRLVAVRSPVTGSRDHPSPHSGSPANKHRLPAPSAPVGRSDSTNVLYHCTQCS